MTRKVARDAPPPEVSYFRGIEEDFVRRRGGALVLSTADWDLMWNWHQSGIPLRVVLRGIADAFEAHAHSWSRRQPVRGLRYCAAEVERARQRWRRALSLDRAEALGVDAHLQGLIAAWGAARLPSELSTERDRLLEALRAGPGGEEVQEWLQARESDLAARLARTAGTKVMGELRHLAESDLERYRDRMPRRTFDRIVEEGLTRRLFERYGVPRLGFLG